MRLSKKERRRPRRKQGGATKTTVYYFAQTPDGGIGDSFRHAGKLGFHAVFKLADEHARRRQYGKVSITDVVFTRDNHLMEAKHIQRLAEKAKHRNTVRRG